MGLQYFPAIKWVGNAHIWFNGGYGVPRPNQLMSKSAVALLKYDERWIRERFDAPFSGPEIQDRFLAENFVGHWPQKAALDAIQATVQTSWQPAKKLGVYLRDGMISEEEARTRFDERLVISAIEEAGTIRYQTNGGDGQKTEEIEQPKCIGLAYSVTATTCQNCSYQTRCGELAERVRERQIEIFGCEDPRQLRSREAAARRKRRSRRKRSAEFQEQLKTTRAAIMQIARSGTDIKSESD
jgi:hypothetical protein